MPNWVYNTITVSGKTEEVKKFVEKAKTPYQTFHEGYGENAGKILEETRTGEIMFWNFKKPENTQAYFGKSDYKPEGYDKLSMEEQLAISMQFKSEGWYDFNNREWGTKWDACNSQMFNEHYHEDGTATVQYSFDTAWSPATGAFEAMVQQHPELHFEFYCEEEQGWGVEFESSDEGELMVTREWDIPSSHADWVKIDREDSCPCAYNDEPEDMYDDCPNNPKATEQAVAEMEDISEMIG
jgi:hypothetical protein